jgi:hypothetical protein
MKSCPLRTSVIGGYPIPGWLEGLRIDFKKRWLLTV